MFFNKKVETSKSLSKRLSLILIVAVSVVSTITTLIVYSINKNTALIQFNEKNKSTITQLEGALIQPIWNIDIISVEYVAKSIIRDETIASLDIYSAENIIYTYKTNFKKNLVEKIITIKNQNEKIGLVKIFFSKHLLNKQLNNIFTTSIILLLVTLLTITILTLIVFKMLLKKPLDNLIKTTTEFSNGNYESYINKSFNEFMPLINVLNSMGKKISKQVTLLNEHKATLEIKVKERTIELAKEKQYISSVINSQNALVITSDGSNVKTINKAFSDYFKLDNKDIFFGTSEQCRLNVINNSAVLHIKECVESVVWLNNIFENKNKIHKMYLNDNIFTISIDRFSFDGEGLYTIVLTDITELEKIKDKIEEISLHTKESIEYSALIQNALLPHDEQFSDYFSDCFLIWQPKDIVGGDIYLFENLRNQNECLIMLIDCTGHGVPGAFVSMLVKAIEKQITTLIKASTEEINTADILKTFNIEMKNILGQKKSQNIANAGFDGGIMYFNKKDNTIKYSGANTTLYYTKDGQLNFIKGNKYSVGYSRSDAQYNFTEHKIDVKEAMTFYLSSDGFIDQSGGEKGFSFGRKRFETMIKKHTKKDLKTQEFEYLKELEEYQGKQERYDDITFLGLKV